MGGDDHMVWLEASGCWARVPREPKRPSTRTNDAQNKRRRHDERRNNSPESSGDKNKHAHAHVATVNEGDLAETSSLCCSICLDEVLTHHKAVITPCMHEYHHTCISKWLTMKQDCPLCKSHVLSVLHNINEDGSFLERELNLPLKHVTNREDIMRRLAEILGEGLNELRHANNTRTISDPNRRRRTPPPQNSQNRRGNQQQQEEQEEHALLAWRREIYDLGLWAIPLGTHHHVPRSLVAPAGRQNRIREWVHRELQALLETEHTTILRGFVMGLLATYGAQPPLSPSRLPPAEILAMNGTEIEAQGSRDDPVSQLRPFLGSAAAHFWHELSCFATAPAYTIRTYDSIVKYSRPGEPVRREEDRERRRERRRDGERGWHREQEREGDVRYNRRDQGRMRRQRSVSRSRSRSRIPFKDHSDRNYHRSSRRRRYDEEEEQEGNYGLGGPLQRRQSQGQDEEQIGDSRWVMWKWGDPVCE